VKLKQKFAEEVAADAEHRSPNNSTTGIGDQERAPGHAVYSGEERRQHAQQRDEAAEEYDLGPVLQEQVLPELDAGFKHADALTVSQQQGVTVSQPEPITGVVANDRAECGDRNHYANVEAGFCRGINGSEYEDRFPRQGQSHTFQPHDERHHPIAMRAHKLL